MRVQYILFRSISPPDGYDVTTDLMLDDMKNNKFRLISIILSKVLTCVTQYNLKRSDVIFFTYEYIVYIYIYLYTQVFLVPVIETLGLY